MAGGVINQSNIYVEQQRLFWKYLRYSIGTHAIAFVLILLYVFLGPSREEPFQPAIQVDIVELPDFVKNERKLVDTSLPVKDEPVPPPPAPEPKTKDEMTLKEDPKPTKDAKSALDRIKEQVERKRRAEEQKRQVEEQKRLKIRQKEAQKFEEKFRNRLGGNNLNQGNSVTGTLATAVNAYAGHVTDKIRNYWELPPFLRDKQNRAIVNLFIDANGGARYYFKKKSGDSVFDNLVKDAIDRSIPFAPPPAELVGELKRRGMEVRFPL